ncbi:flagellar biosynthetic protein FliO [Ampullimonas aquatilis]|uniref:flagellar biosynthetic protein FliO n=1 Tax=Ampullimonas aquatilis TaxID=1341549 RepID=UPI003C77E4D8
MLPSFKKNKPHTSLTAGVIAALIVLTTLPLKTLAAEAIKNNTVAPVAVTPMSTVPQMVLGLLLVLGLIMGAAWVLKRMGMTNTQPTSLLKVVSSISVGTRERVAVIEVDNTWVVVGITASGITALHTQTKGALPESALNNPHAAAGFARVLEQFKQKKS